MTTSSRATHPTAPRRIAVAGLACMAMAGLAGCAGQAPSTAPDTAASSSPAESTTSSTPSSSPSSATPSSSATGSASASASSSASPSASASSSVTASPSTSATPQGATTFGDGTHTDITPGTYKATPTTPCHWERLKDGGVVALGDSNSGTQVVVIIEQGDTQFTSRGCGTWTRLG